MMKRYIFVTEEELKSIYGMGGSSDVGSSSSNTSTNNFSVTEAIYSGNTNWYNDPSLWASSEVATNSQTQTDTSNDSQGWSRTGSFGEDYSKVPGATAPYHLGEDWIFQDSSGSNTTMGHRVQNVAAGTVLETGYNDTVGNFIRIQTCDGARIDYFHLNSISVLPNQQVGLDQVIGSAGDTGVGNAHLHIAMSYQQGQAPASSGSTIDAYGRTYVDPLNPR
jgi:murein DD-endopeptidase MepM/ murein hydrolase activator NlpD